MFRFTKRNLLCLAIFLALGVTWCCFWWGIGSREATAKKQADRPPDEVISEYRQLLNDLN